MKRFKKIFFVILVLAIFNTGCKKTKIVEKEKVIKIEDSIQKEVKEDDIKKEDVTKQEIKEENIKISEDEFVKLDNYYKKIELENLDAEYFINKIRDFDKIIMNKEKIKEFNDKNIENCEMLYDLKKYPEILKFEKIKSIIQNISKPSKSIRYKKDGIQVKKEDYDNLYKNLNLEGNDLDDINIKFAISINRTIMKTYPTDMKISVNPGDIDFDRFTETAVYPYEPMVVLHQSRDKKWSFVQIYNYNGWVKNEDIVIGDKNEILKYVNSEDYAVFTSSQVNLSFYDEYNGEIKNISYDMGVKVKIEKMAENEKYILAYIPIKDKKDNMQFKKINIEKKNVNIGFLPYTKENIIKQAFKFSSEYYGWGGLNNSRDCSAFIMDIFRTFGINLPRNSSEQGKDSLGKIINFSENDSLKNRESKLNMLDAGAALYMPGHVMLYLGEHNNKHYVIHTFTGYYKNNNFQEVMKVAVSTLDINSKDGKTYMEKIYAGKEFYIKK